MLLAGTLRSCSRRVSPVASDVQRKAGPAKANRDPRHQSDGEHCSRSGASHGTGWSHLVLRPTRVRQRCIVEWRGDALRAQIPRNADEGAGAARFVLLDRRNGVLADSGNRMFRVAAHEAPNAGRAAGGGSSTSVPGRGPRSLATGLPGVVVVPDFLGGSQVKVPPLTLPPGPDPRTGRGVAAQSITTFTTPRIAAQSLEVEIEERSRARRQPPFLRDQRLLGMDYRHFPARSVAECHTACSVEAQCRAWSLRPARSNNTYDNSDDGPVCWLKTGIPQREYARGMSPASPPPPAVGRASRRHLS
jgi:hypothetical protein